MMLLHFCALLSLAPSPTLSGDWIDSYLQGERALEAGDLDAAKAAFAHSFEEQPEHAPSAWGLACVAALAGDADAAFTWLDAVAEAGGAERALLEWDEDLASLREDERFGDLVENWNSLDASLETWHWVPAWDSRCNLSDFDGKARRVTRRDGQVYDFLAGERIAASSLSAYRPPLTSPGASTWGATPPFEYGAEQWEVSPDLRRAVAIVRGSNENTNALVVDVDARRVIRVHEGLPTIPTTAIAFSPDSTFVALNLNRDRSLRVYESEGGEEVLRLENEDGGSISSCFFSTENHVAVLEKRGRVSVYEVPSGEQLYAIEVPLEGYAILRSAMGGKRLIVPENHRRVRVYDTTKERRLLIDSRKGLTEWEPGGWSIEDGQSIAIQQTRHRVQLHSLVTGELEGVLQSETVACEWVIHPSTGDLWGTTVDGYLLGVAGQTGERIATFPLADAPLVALDISPRGDRLACIDAEGGLHVLEGIAGSQPRLQTLDGVPILAGRWKAQLKFSPDGSRLLASVCYGPCLVLDTSTGEVLLLREPGRFMGSSAWALDSSELFLTVSSSQIEVFHFEDAGASRTISIDGEIGDVEIEPGSGNLWVACKRAGIDILERSSGELLNQIEFEEAVPFASEGFLAAGSLSFDPLGQRAVLTTAWWGSALCWNVENGERLWVNEYGGGTGALIHHQFTEDGKRLYVYGQMYNRARMLSVEDGSDLQSYDRLEALHLLGFEGDQLYAPHTDGRLRKIDPKSGEVLWTHVAARAGGWLLTSPDGSVDGTSRALHELHIQLPDAHAAISDVAGTLLDAKRVRASIAGVPLASPNRPLPPGIVWKHSLERILQAPENQTSLCIGVMAESESGLLGFEIKQGGRTEVLPGTADGVRRRLRYLVEAAEDGSPRDVRIQALGSRGTRSAPVHYRVVFEAP